MPIKVPAKYKKTKIEKKLKNALSRPIEKVYANIQKAIIPINVPIFLL